jgi:signal transduction histidine kinase
MAQNVHDILGHSLTVVIGTAELAASDDAHGAMQKTLQIEELLTGSLNDLKNALDGKGTRWGETSLIKAIQHLKNEKITVSIQTQGKTYELSTAQTEAVYRLCQEAVTNAIKHGKASHIYLILRFSAHVFEIYAVDNGVGCHDIKKSYGLEGIEKRVNALAGTASFVSDGESGFTIHAELPISSNHFSD